MLIYVETCLVIPSLTTDRTMDDPQRNLLVDEVTTYYLAAYFRRQDLANALQWVDLVAAVAGPGGGLVFIPRR
ncbi:hypothetical protein EBZ39_17145, partial [bacterium]|nr:hypothetical protein [bacterium]